MRHVLKMVNVRKAAGFDLVLSKVAEACAHQLGFIQSFQSFLDTFPIPVPERRAINILNEYRPIALISVVMKCLERLVSQYIKNCLSLNFDPHE